MCVVIVSNSLIVLIPPIAYSEWCKLCGAQACSRGPRVRCRTLTHSNSTYHTHSAHTHYSPFLPSPSSIIMSVVSPPPLNESPDCSGSVVPAPATPAAAAAADEATYNGKAQE